MARKTREVDELEDAECAETNWPELKKALTTGHGEIRHGALIRMKDEIIGSNRQKGALISYGLVPALLKICSTTSNDEENLGDKTNALIILGSLAKGSSEQVQILVERYDIIPVLIQEIILENNNKKCIEICLSTMRSIYEQPYSTGAPVDDFFTDACSLTYFLGLASSGSSLKTQICVTSILVSLCQTYDDQIRLLHAGTIHVLARMICFENEHIQIPALRCLACMSRANRSVTDIICVTSFQGRSLPDILNSLMSRLFSPEIQLTAARCLTHIYRSGTLLSTDCRILHKTLPSLARLCSEGFVQSTRAAASETLAYLIEVDSELQRTAAISNHLLKSLSQLLQSEESLIKQAALRCFASLGANDEAIRKRIMDANGLIDAILEGLNDNNTQVQLASVRCLHSLSRSVQQLRTTFQDHSLWKPLLFILSSQPTIEFLIAVTSTICNLLLEFSPSKDPMLNAGIADTLCQFLEHADPALRLNSVWALMNMSFQAEQRVKTDIINTLGTKRILELLCDSNAMIVMKTLGLLRNLLSKSFHIDIIMTAHSVQVMDAVNMILASNHSASIKEQVLCIVGNIAAEAQSGDYILNDEKIMTRLGQLLFHPDHKLQAGALFAIRNIVHRKDSWSEEKYARLAELDIIKNVNELNKKAVRSKVLSEDYIYRTLKEIVMKCKHFCPDTMMN